MLEKDVEALIKDFVKRSPRSWCIKIHADATQGKESLDLFGSFEGRPFFVDVKRSSGGTPSDMQTYLINRALETGYVSGYVKSLNEFIRLFDE